MARSDANNTKVRLIAAAGALFAERGFHASTMREIAVRAGVNLAAANYHFGSKRALYLEVLRQQFAEVRTELEQRGAALPGKGSGGRLPARQLRAVLEARTRAMLDLMVGPPPGVHGTLMQREMTDPSEAIPVIAAEFIAPMADELREIIALMEPRLAGAALDRCVYSIVGQAVFYRFAMPAMLHLLGRDSYPRGFSGALARHITIFSIGGMSALAEEKGKGDAL